MTGDIVIKNPAIPIAVMLGMVLVLALLAAFDVGDVRYDLLLVLDLIQAGWRRLRHPQS